MENRWLKKFSKSCQEILQNNNKLWYHVRCDDIESVRKHLQIPIFNKDIIKRDTF